MHTLSFGKPHCLNSTTSKILGPNNGQPFIWFATPLAQVATFKVFAHANI